jgi:lysozyme
MPAFWLIFGGLALVALAIYGKTSGGFMSSLTGGDASGDDTAPAADSSDPNDPVSAALAIIKTFEGFSPNAYADPPGQSVTYSIGYGHQIRAGESYNLNSVIGESEASDLLRVDVGVAWTCVFQSVKVDCSPQQFAALISLCFNIGCGAFKSSSVLRDLNAGDPDTAAEDFMLWNKVTISDGSKVADAGLTMRRTQEQSIFQGGAIA